MSTTITPLLRETHCFGELSCYSLAFGVPGILMIVSIGRFEEFFFRQKMDEIKLRFFFLDYSNFRTRQTILYDEGTGR